MVKGNWKADGCVFRILGALTGAVVCGGLFCVAVEILGEREDEAMQQEIRERTAGGEKDAELNVMMKHKTMPIARALGVLMALVVVCSVSGLLGGTVAALVVCARAERALGAVSSGARVGPSDSPPRAAPTDKSKAKEDGPRDD